MQEMTWLHLWLTLSGAQPPLEMKFHNTANWWSEEGPAHRNYSSSAMKNMAALFPKVSHIIQVHLIDRCSAPTLCKVSSCSLPEGGQSDCRLLKTGNLQIKS